MAGPSVDYWIYGQSAYEIELFHHTKTRAIFGMVDRPAEKNIAWYMFSATLAKKLQSEFAAADWMDPKSETPFARHDVPVGAHHPFAVAFGLDKLVDSKVGNDATLTIDAKRDKSFLYFDLRIKKTANGLVSFRFGCKRIRLQKPRMSILMGDYTFWKQDRLTPKKFKVDASKNRWANRRLIDSLGLVAHGERAWSIGRRVCLILTKGWRSCPPKATASSA